MDCVCCSPRKVWRKDVLCSSSGQVLLKLVGLTEYKFLPAASSSSTALLLLSVFVAQPRDDLQRSSLTRSYWSTSGL